MAVLSDLVPVTVGALHRLARSVRSRLFAALLVLDVALLGLHMAVTGFGQLDPRTPGRDWLRIDRDGSLPELVELVLLLGSAGLVAAAATTRRRWATLPLAGLLVVLAADNALGIHENASAVLLPGHQNWGEMLFFGLLFLAAAGVSLAGWYRADRDERCFYAAAWAGIALLGAFGVGLDALHIQAWKWFVWAERWIGIAEDFGETVAISLVAAIAWCFFRETVAARRTPVADRAAPAGLAGSAA